MSQSSFPPPAPLRESTSKARISTARARESLTRLLAMLPRPCSHEAHAALKASDRLWQAQPLLAHTDARGLRSAGPVEGGQEWRNCALCMSTLIRPVSR